MSSSVEPNWTASSTLHPPLQGIIDEASPVCSPAGRELVRNRIRTLSANVTRFVGRSRGGPRYRKNNTTKCLCDSSERQAHQGRVYLSQHWASSKVQDMWHHCNQLLPRLFRPLASPILGACALLSDEGFAMPFLLEDLSGNLLVTASFLCFCSYELTSDSDISQHELCFTYLSSRS